MSNKNSEHSEAATENLRIEQLREETRELSDEQSKAIAGGQSGLNLSDEQLESDTRKRGMFKKSILVQGIGDF